MRTPSAALLLFAVCGACANHRNFLPRENRNGIGPGGQPAAVYPVLGDHARGEVRLWSRGSDAAKANAGEATEVHVGFELENTGDLPLQLAVDALQCDEIVVGEWRATGVRASRTAGEPVAPPGTTARFDAWFPVDRGGPKDVASFAVRFRIDAAAAPVLVQVTPFAPYIVSDPYPYDPWAWRAGPGFGWYGHYRRW